MSGTATIPIVLTIDGPVPTPPADLRAQLVVNATAMAPPGLTTTLPGSLIEDIASTDTGALVVMDQARVDLINSVTPRGANAFLLNQLGQMFGVPIGTQSNTSVFVVFSGTAGFVLGKGFVVSDGTYQYVLQDGGVITSGGLSQPLSAIATQQGSWAIAPNSVTQFVTSIPTRNGNPLVTGVTNPLAGIPGAGGETEASYRAAVLQAGVATAQGIPSMLKTLLRNIPGVQSRLVSVRQQTGGGWEIICGGSGDPYQIGYAILYALPDISSLVGSVMAVINVTNANPAVLTTSINHGFTNGQIVTVNGATGMAGLNGVARAVTVVSLTRFSVPFNSTSAGTYTGNGVVTPNFRNVTTNIYDYPDIYTVPFVVPPMQAVTMVITWNTTATGFVSASAVASATQPAIAAYVNALPVGQPMNLFQLQATFQVAIAPLVDPTLLTRMVFNVAINGIGVAPDTGTGIIDGDPESYFQTTTASITVNQG